MAKCRIGHFVEAQVLEAIEIDYIDESEVLSPADDVYHIDKTTVQGSVCMRCAVIWVKLCAASLKAHP